MSEEKTPDAEPAKDKAAAAADPKKNAPRPERTVRTQHNFEAGDRRFQYTATAGTLNLRDPKDEDTASLFYVAYTLDDVPDPTHRPVTFCFNGGPGSSSVWLQFGALGPKRVDIPDAVAVPPPPYLLIDNPQGILDRTDLVFLDPVGTGFSRAQGETEGKAFHSVADDAKSVARFIEQYLTRYQRWNAPRFLAGESYGTTRAAAVAWQLQERGVALNGLALLSLALNFKTFFFEPDNHLAHIMFLPSYAAVAWYHGRLAKQPHTLAALLGEARRFALDVYAPALMRGHGLDPARRTEVAAGLARLTGLDAAEIERRGLRLDYLWVAKQMLGAGRETVGRLDGRYRGPDDDHGDRMKRDPSFDAPYGAFTAAANDHLRRTLRWDGDDAYEVISVEVNQSWEWAQKGKMGYPDTAGDLARTMLANPHLKVLIGCGVFDLATPFMAAEYTADRLDVPADLRAHVTVTHYEAGHMMYFHEPSRVQLRADLAAFYDAAAPQPHRA